MSVASWLGRTIGLTDSKFFATYFGSRNSTGKPVNVDSALTVSAAFACVRLLSESAGILTMGVYRKRPDGGREEVRTSPAFGLIHDGPNPDLTAVEYWEQVVAQLATEGNAFALKIYDGRRLSSLEPILPYDMQVTRNPTTHDLRYRFSWRGKTYDVGADRVVHFRGFGKGGDLGVSVIRYGANTLGIAMAGDDTAGNMFKNGTHSSGFIQTNGGKVLSADQRTQFTKSLESFRSDENAGKFMLLEGGFEFEAFGINPNDLQLLQARGFSIEQVCALFRVPPFMIGHTEKSTSWGTGLEQQVIGFLTFALLPYLRKIESRANVAFLTPEERDAGLYCKFNIESLLRADSAARMAFYSAAAQNGIMSRNEIRAKEELGSVEGGDQVTVQSNLVPLDRLGEVLSSGGGSGATVIKQALRRFLEIEDAKPTPQNPA